MCGRFTLASPGEVVAEVFGLDDPPDLAPRWNICPSEAIAVVRANREGGRRLDLLHWGLVPYWASDPGIGARLINARAETLATRNAFREPLARRRCAIVADGFYEWTGRASSRRPFHIRRPDARPFAIAGLWERWQSRGSGPLESCTIVTTEPCPVVAELHDRMPAILEPAQLATWLDPSVCDPAALLPLLGPFAGELVARPASRRVNSPANDDAGCLEAEDDPLFSRR